MSLREELRTVRGLAPSPERFPERAELREIRRAHVREPSPYVPARPTPSPIVYGIPSIAPSPTPTPTPTPSPRPSPTRAGVTPTPTNAKTTFIGARPLPSLSPLMKHKTGATFYLEQLEEQRKRRLKKYGVTEKPEAKPEAKPVVLTIPATLKFGDYEVKTSHVVIGVSIAVVVIALLVFT